MKKTCTVVLSDSGQKAIGVRYQTYNIEVPRDDVETAVGELRITTERGTVVYAAGMWAKAEVVAA